VAKPAVASRRILLLLAVTALALMTFDVRGFGPIDSARSTALAVTAPFRSFVGRVASPVSDTWHGAVHYDDVLAENDRLRADVARLEGELARLPDVEADYDELLEATELDFGTDLQQVTARVVSDRRTGIERILEINRGSADGLAAGMPVVIGSGLTGLVDDVFAENRSTIRLITDSRVSVGVDGVDSGQVGIANGDGDGSPLILDLTVRALEEVANGERFETTGFSEVFPQDIPVGILVIDPDTGATRLDPLVDFDRLGFVTILITERPS